MMGRERGDMSIRPTLAALVGLLVTAAPVATAQQRPQVDSTEVQLKTTLRAFYFNLAHRDWEALAADILSAKVVAHRPAPEALLQLAARPAPGVRSGAALASDDSPQCSSPGGALVDQAVFTLDGEWAEASVPRCDAPAGGADEFRLIRFEGRWRVVYIDLVPEPSKVQLAR